MLELALLALPTLTPSARPQDSDPSPAPSAESQGQDGEAPEHSPLDELDWKFGPGEGDLASWARVQIPEGWRFVGPRDTRKLMEMMQNPVTMTETGFLSPPEMQWFAVFEFDESGYVEDSDKDELDADEMLESLKEGTEAGNEARRERGWATLEVLDWEVPPHYDEITHNLEWATRARSSDGGLVINHNTRLLGRRGVMSVTLVVDPEGLAAALPEFKQALGGYSFKEGQRYTEFASGDKVAEYGLTALVAGGAGVVAAKSGLLGKLWKLILPAVLAVGAFFKKLFGGGKKETARTRE
ncbi:MAG: DUF2167 domain-containing protein [Planctomycetes bacterium]|nr:DUF2167 domain-containing protein [Planctomycetota bacterium]